LVREAIPAAPKATNPSLGHLASYARIAIQISKISRERRVSLVFARRTRNKIAQPDGAR